MLFISSKIPEDYKVADAPELADRVYPGDEYPVLDENDMIRVYVPLDISPDLIRWRLYEVYDLLGSPSENNEYLYRYEIDRLITQLEIYDRIMMEQGKPVNLITGHTVKATEIAELMINKLLEDDGTAELFPYNMVDIIKEKFGMN